MLYLNVYLFLRNFFGNQFVICVNFFCPLLHFNYRVSVTGTRKRSDQGEKPHK